MLRALAGGTLVFFGCSVAAELPAWVEPVAQAIALVEGWRDPASLVRREHNPGALAFAGQEGATCGIRGFARFASDELGWRALRKDLELKIARGMTVEAIARARAGRTDDVEAYVRILVSAAKGPRR